VEDAPSKDTGKASTQLDEIDQALKALAMSAPKPQPKAAEGLDKEDGFNESTLFKYIATDTQYLHAANEMRRLFGRAALEADNEEEEAGRGGGRRRARGQQRAGLAGAVAGRNQPGGRGLAGLGLRRNIFIQGKEEWPRATGSGLGMEIVQNSDREFGGGAVEYRFVHTRPYQDVQRQFETCVQSMDPERMIQLLQNNPYHISTLLQVSEIAKQERDHATSGDLLERALFSFGRSVHSTFASNLAQGKARFDFSRPENREFWLAASRYINNLGMRSTWRTVFEWARLLFALDPFEDPYQMYLVMDQYAIRAKRQQEYLDLRYSAYLNRQAPNIWMSTGLALYQLGKSVEARKALQESIETWPWVAARLFTELNLDQPPSIWGKLPRTDTEKLFCELYALRAKDIWNTPEVTGFLVEVAYAAKPTESTIAEENHTPISYDTARHVYLTDQPALIALLPRALTNQIDSSSDPLPPTDNIESYSTQSGSRQARNGRGPTIRTPEDLGALQTFLQRMGTWFGAADAERQEEDGTHVVNGAAIRRHMAEDGITEEQFLANMEIMRRILPDEGAVGSIEQLLGRMPEGFGRGATGDNGELVLWSEGESDEEVGGVDGVDDEYDDLPDLVDIDEEDARGSRQARVMDAEDDGT